MKASPPWGGRFRRPASLFKKNVTIITSVDPSFERGFPLGMQWVAEQRVDVEKLITHRYGVDDCQTAFETFRDKADGALKVIVDFKNGR